MIKTDDVYRIGRLGKPHGVRGEVSFQVDDDVFDRVDADYLFLSVDGLLVPFFIEEYRFRSDELCLMKFEGIDSDEQAHELTGCEVFFPRQLAANDEDDASWPELIGYHIIDAATRQPVGKLRDVDDSTINILFDVDTEAGQVLIPAGGDLIQAIDKAERTITMTIPDGLVTRHQ